MNFYRETTTTTTTTTRLLNAISVVKKNIARGFLRYFANEKYARYYIQLRLGNIIFATAYASPYLPPPDPVIPGLTCQHGLPLMPVSAKEVGEALDTPVAIRPVYMEGGRSRRVTRSWVSSELDIDPRPRKLGTRPACFRSLKAARPSGEGFGRVSSARPNQAPLYALYKLLYSNESLSSIRERIGTSEGVRGAREKGGSPD